MSKRESSKYKIDRRMGENIWGRPKSPVNLRSYGPGSHGQRRKSKPSYFGLQLRAKQKMKKYYGDISEKQFHSIFKEADRCKGDTSENLISFLESRLDTIVYRSKFVPTVFAARQFVNHRHVKVNGSSVNIGSYRCKAGDVIEVREKSKNMLSIQESMQLPERDVPDYIGVDKDKLIATLIRVPASQKEVPYPVIMEPNLIVEFYSR
ncbi:30S ribosomal protein S4 [Candidatus Liberibacter sp.]|uniref:30S ribosomal protein S4 n=1 Tax=Candidatus Liberibacter sp. TaxID=34022 RepID=UPI0015F76215|nr:30S ribosomal protein S4 [Candidatus Liberibacter sp.]MBA5723832.1 30S ribosomal protein S4 [Candidatus Liberibacter sp.]